MRRDLIAILWARFERADGYGVTKVMQPHLWDTRQPNRGTQQTEYPMRCHVTDGSPSNRHEDVVRSGHELQSAIQVSCQSDSGTVVQRYEAIFSEFCFPDNQAIVCEIFDA